MDGLLEHDPDILRPPWGPYGRDLTLGVVSSAAKLLLRVANTLTVEDTQLERFRQLTMQREEGVGLLTYCNHTSTFDDPGLPSAMLPWWMFWLEHQHGKMRWTMCAADVCFKSELLSQFFSNGKTLPVQRGSSVHQPAITAAGRVLGGGGWLHVFPEGKVQPGGDVGAFRQGIGKLVCDARAVAGHDPVVLPYFHSGMARVVPYLKMLPRVGQEVTVVVGEPVDLSAITCRCNQPGEDQVEVWRDIAAALREALLELEARAPPNRNQLEERPHLRDIIAARCRQRRRSGSGGDGSGSGDSSSSGQRESFRLAAIALAEPCQTFNAWCHVLPQPYWAGEQQERQQQLVLALGRRGAWHQQQQCEQQQQQQQQQQGQAGLEQVAGESQQSTARRWLSLWRRAQQQQQREREQQQTDSPAPGWYAWLRRGEASTTGVDAAADFGPPTPVPLTKTHPV